MSNGDEHEVVEAPEGWRTAIPEFDQSGFSYGDIVPKSWFYEAFGIEQPKPQTSLKQAQEAELKRLAAFKEFENYLLSERSMALKTVHGVGYEIVMPTQQTAWATEDRDRALKKTFSKAAQRLLNVDHDQLTPPQSRENAEALARNGALRALMFGRKKLKAETLLKLGKDDG